MSKYPLEICLVFALLDFGKLQELEVLFFSFELAKKIICQVYGNYINYELKTLEFNIKNMLFSKKKKSNFLREKYDYIYTLI